MTEDLADRIDATAEPQPVVITHAAEISACEESWVAQKPLGSVKRCMDFSQSWALTLL